MTISMKELFEIIDRMDAGGFSAAFTEDGRFRFGNAPTVTGRDGIAKTVGDFFAGLQGLRHEILDVWDEGDSVISEVEVMYTRKDGSEIQLPAATIGRRRDGLLADYRIYMDVNPLFEPAG
jgi:ketosteroid isomerase-like protein